jgi:hypothetical protein
MIVSTCHLEAEHVGPAINNRAPPEKSRGAFGVEGTEIMDNEFATLEAARLEIEPHLPNTTVEYEVYEGVPGLLFVLGGPLWEAQIVRCSVGFPACWCGEQCAGDYLMEAVAPWWERRGFR